MNLRMIIEGICAEHKQVRAKLHMQLVKGSAIAECL